MSIEQVYRDEWGRLLALLVAQTRRLDLAEDALGDAFEAAARRWPTGGEPANPPAWLLTTARRRIVDRLRGEATAARKEPLLVVEEEHRMDTNETSLDSEPDDLLRLVLLAAHPSLAPEAGAALTLRLVLGVPTPDIARLFLVSEPTMAARLTRARKKVVAAGVPMTLPPPEVLPERLDTVAQVAYLAFTAGYAPGSGPDVVRAELAGEAIRLVRIVLASIAAGQRNPTLIALLALMLLQHSRRDARVSSTGELVLLPEQDRALWHRAEIEEGLRLLAALTGTGSQIALGSALAASYLLQGLIAAEHARAVSAADTDWVTIADLYLQLDELTGSPVVRMNRAVAVAEAGDVVAALGLLSGLDEAMPHSHRLLPGHRADLHARRGDREAALSSYERAISLCDNEPERAVLHRKLKKNRHGIP